MATVCPGRDRRRDAVQHRPAVVGERQVAELDGAREAAGRSGVRLRVGVRDGRLGVHHGEHPLPGGHPPLDHVGDPAEGDHRPRHHHEVRVEGDELAERDALVDDLAAAEPQHEQRAQAEKQRHAREEEALQPDQPAVAVEVLLVRGAEPLDLGVLLPVGADRRARPTAPPGRPRSRPRAAPGCARSAGGSPLPKYFTDTDTNGIGISAISVSHGSIDSIIASATKNSTTVFDGVHDRRPDHHADRVQVVGGARHQVAGARRRGSRPSGSVCRCAKKSLRRSYSMCRETPTMIRRIRKRKAPPTTAMPKHERRVEAAACRA